MLLGTPRGSRHLTPRTARVESLHGRALVGHPAQRLPSAAHHVDVEDRRTDDAHQRQPHRQVHLRRPGGAQTAEVEHPLGRPAELAEQARSRPPWPPRRRPRRRCCAPPSSSAGSTMTAAFMVFSDLTTRACGTARCSCSARLSVFATDSVGGKPCEKSSGFDASSTTVPSRTAAASRAASEPVAAGRVDHDLGVRTGFRQTGRVGRRDAPPPTRRTTATRSAPGCPSTSRVPTTTSCPRSAKAAASVRPSHSGAEHGDAHAANLRPDLRDPHRIGHTKVVPIRCGSRGATVRVSRPAARAVPTCHGRRCPRGRREHVAVVRLDRLPGQPAGPHQREHQQVEDPGQQGEAGAGHQVRRPHRPSRPVVDEAAHDGRAPPSPAGRPAAAGGRRGRRSSPPGGRPVCPRRPVRRRRRGRPASPAPRWRAPGPARGRPTSRSRSCSCTASRSRRAASR